MNTYTGPAADASIGERVLYAREARGITRQELDRRLDGGQSYTRKIEEGAIRRPGAHKLRALCEVLEVPLEWLIGSDRSPPDDADIPGSIRVPASPVIRRRSSGELPAAPRRPSGELPAVVGPTVPSPAPEATDPATLEALDAALGTSFAADRHTVADLMAAREALVRAGVAAADAGDAGFHGAVARVLGAVASLRRDGRALSYAALILRAHSSHVDVDGMP